MSIRHILLLLLSFISTSSFCQITKNGFEVWQATGENVIVRKGPGKQYDKVTTLNKTAPFLVSGESGEWLKIKEFVGRTTPSGELYINRKLAQHGFCPDADNFPCEVIVKEKTPYSFSKGLYVNTDGYYKAGDTLRIVNCEYVSGLGGYSLEVSGGSYIPSLTVNFTTEIKKDQLSRYSYTPTSLKWQIIGMMVLAFVILLLHVNGWNWVGLILSICLVAWEYLYLENTTLATWFVNPDIIGWPMTILNGFLFLIALSAQWAGITISLSMFNIGKISCGVMVALFIWGLMIGGFDLRLCLIAGGIVAICTFFKEISLAGFGIALVGGLLWALMLYFGNEILCHFNGFFAAVAGLFLLAAGTSSPSAQSGRKVITLDNGVKITTNRYSECSGHGDDGNDYEWQVPDNWVKR